jgi:pimeloyl-ACP methyl ester carboxylesterase
MNPNETRPLLQKIDKGSASSARPALVFIHGAGHSAQCWDEHFLDYFADRGYRAIAPDMHGRGCGASIADRVSRVHALAADLPSAPILIGHASGGYLVQEYLRTHRTPAAVLLCSAPSPTHLSAMMRGTRLRDLLFGAGTADALVEACYADRDDDALRSLSPALDPTQEPRPKLRLLRPYDTLTPLLVIDGSRDSWDPSVARSLARDHHTKAELMPGLRHDAMHGPGWMAVAERIRRWVEAVHLRVSAARTIGPPDRIHRFGVVGTSARTTVTPGSPPRGGRR